MNNEFLLLVKKHKGKLIEETKTKPQETLEYKMNKQMETFSFSPPINLSEEGKWLLRVTSFETMKSVFIITDENNSFSITIEGHWSSRGGAGTIKKLQKLLMVRPKNNIELHVEEVSKKENQIEIGDKEKNLSDLDTCKKEIIEELKIAE